MIWSKRYFITGIKKLECYINITRDKDSAVIYLLLCTLKGDVPNCKESWLGPCTAVQ